MISAPPKPVMVGGKDYYEVAAMNAHLKELRAALARSEFATNGVKREADNLRADRDYWRLKVLRN